MNLSLSEPKRPTVSMRLPDKVVAEAKDMAKLHGITVGEELGRAWDWWWRRNQDRIIPEMHEAVEALRR